MNTIALVFPHQLFEQVAFPKHCEAIYLVEEYLFFRQYPFHKQKIAFHRASMKFYEQHLRQQGWNVIYIDAQQILSDIRLLIPHLKQQGIEAINYLDPIDCWLERRIKASAQESGLTLQQHPSALFINQSSEINDYFGSRDKFLQNDFYIQQRKRRRVLIDDHGKPRGGKWSFDDENRLKYPKGKTPPKRNLPPANAFHEEAWRYTETYFPNNYGQLNKEACYPCTFEDSKQWLNNFLRFELSEFGAYEDAIVASSYFLHHSVLTPMLNVGLLTPQFIIDESLSFASQQHVPLNSLEGFIRQILGWREFIRGVYETKGTAQRKRNAWGFSRKIPDTWWHGTTGITPIDITIKKILATGYCHHIERLMVLGNFMLLCEFDPDEVYRWFMTLFIDAYDWVMVPNVYGMSQFADGGLMATKPYISGSNYLMKMSDYPKGDWQLTWDALFWNFMHQHRQFFSQNPRLGMLIKTFDKMPEEKRQGHLARARDFLSRLDS
jgi:deoxyribodipyrimidine photolyase-related protein